MIEPRIQHHARSGKYSLARVSQRDRLCDSSFCAADDVLRFVFDPEVWRIVSEIGNQRDELGLGKRCPNALRQCTIEIWNNGQNDLDGILLPIFLQGACHRVMPEANHRVQHHEELRSKASPALAKEQVVAVLQADFYDFL